MRKPIATEDRILVVCVLLALLGMELRIGQIINGSGPSQQTTQDSRND